MSKHHLFVKLEHWICQSTFVNRGGCLVQRHHCTSAWKRFPFRHEWAFLIGLTAQNGISARGVYWHFLAGFCESVQQGGPSISIKLCNYWVLLV